MTGENKLRSNIVSLVSAGAPLYKYLRKRSEEARFWKTVEIGATLLLITFFALFAVKPTAVTISALVGEIKSKELLVTQMRTKINRVVAAQDEFTAVHERYVVVNGALPDMPAFDQVKNQLTKTASESGIMINSIDFAVRNMGADSEKESGGVKTYVANIKVKTVYSNLIRWMARLGNNRRLWELNDLRISKVDKLETANQMADFDIDFMIYYWFPGRNN